MRSLPRVEPLAVLALLVALGPFACGHDAPAPSASSASSAAPSASASAPSEPSPSETAAERAEAPLAVALVPTEARRLRLARLADDPDLAANERAIRAHFGDVPAPLDVQIAELDGGRFAWLLYDGRSAPEPHAGTAPARKDERDDRDASPFVLVLDGRGEVVFTKDRPLAGIHPGVHELAIAPASGGGLSLVWYDAPSHTVAVRTWQPDGTVLADHVLLQVESCDALSALRWPDHGLVVVASQRGGARAQRLGEDGLLAWGRDGIAVPAAWRAPAPVSLAWAGGALFFVHHGHARGASGPGAADHLVAERYDAAGALLWPRPLDLGPVARVADPKQRVAIESVEDGTARVTLGTRAGPHAVVVTPDGTAIRR